MRNYVPMLLVSSILCATSHVAFAVETKPKVIPSTTFVLPYPERVDPFRQPINSEVIASRRDASVQQLNLKLKGFIDVGDRKAVLEINEKIVVLATGETRHDIRMIEMTPHAVTLQRGRHRWTESLLRDTKPEGQTTTEGSTTPVK